MCFSAPASFAAAAVTGIIGLASLAKSDGWRSAPLAAMPLLFAAQQFIEGLLWFTLPVAPDGGDANLLTLLFLLFAVVLWPVYAPVSALLVEPAGWRRSAMWGLVVAGGAVAVFFAAALASDVHHASILGGHIFYDVPRKATPVVAIGYLIATCAPLLISSHKSVNVLGAIVTAGAVLSYAFYWQAFASVWCFFAAAASIVLYHHFASEARERQALTR